MLPGMYVLLQEHLDQVDESTQSIALHLKKPCYSLLKIAVVPRLALYLSGARTAEISRALGMCWLTNSKAK